MFSTFFRKAACSSRAWALSFKIKFKSGRSIFLRSALTEGWQITFSGIFDSDPADATTSALRCTAVQSAHELLGDHLSPLQKPVAALQWRNCHSPASAFSKHSTGYVLPHTSNVCCYHFTLSNIHTSQSPEQLQGGCILPGLKLTFQRPCLCLRCFSNKKKKKKTQHVSASDFEIYQLQSKVTRINNQGSKCPVWLNQSRQVVDLSIILIKSQGEVELTILNSLSPLATCLSYRWIVNVTHAAVA